MEVVPPYQSSIVLIGIMFGWVFFNEAAGVPPNAMALFAVGAGISVAGIFCLIFKKGAVKGQAAAAAAAAVADGGETLPLTAEEDEETALMSSHGSAGTFNGTTLAGMEAGLRTNPSSVALVSSDSTEEGAAGVAGAANPFDERSSLLDSEHDSAATSLKSHSTDSAESEGTSTLNKGGLAQRAGAAGSSSSSGKPPLLVAAGGAGAWRAIEGSSPHSGSSRRLGGAGGGGIRRGASDGQLQMGGAVDDDARSVSSTATGSRAAAGGSHREDNVTESMRRMSNVDGAVIDMVSQLTRSVSSAVLGLRSPSSTELPSINMGGGAGSSGIGSRPRGFSNSSQRSTASVAQGFQLSSASSFGQ